MKPNFIIFYISEQKQTFPHALLALKEKNCQCKLEQACLGDALERLDEFKEDNQELAICLFDVDTNPTATLIYDALVQTYPQSQNIVLYSDTPWPNSLQRLNQQSLFSTFQRDQVEDINNSLKLALARFSETKQLRHQNQKLQNQVEQLKEQLSERTTELLKKNINLQNLSVTDKLTQLPNRLKLDEQLNHHLTFAQRYHTEFSIILLDIDHFKLVNDQYGHTVGDSVLMELAQILQSHVRKTDTVGRWGGEEFLILSPNSGKEEALLFAEKLRIAIESFSFTTIGTQTASFGITDYQPNDTEKTLLDRADQALYLAKENGRNRIEQQ